MLPSTGYFKGINCPFYDSGLCERPYCHFRHVKKESQSNAGDGIESGAILQQLVSEAVKKVLQQTEASGSPKHAPSVETSVTENYDTLLNQSLQKVTYNPTPISELQKLCDTEPENDEILEQRKRHIPVPYTPRKPVSAPIKRPVVNGDTNPLYIAPQLKYTPGSKEGPILDPYTPFGGIESKEKYLPGSEKELQEYKPVETVQSQTSTKLNYIPSDKNANKKKLLEYKPTKVSSSKKDTSFVTYQPTPRCQVPCFSSDEDEPKVKKSKLSADLNGLDDLGAEFDMLDQILDEEKCKDDSKTITSASKKPFSNDKKQDEIPSHSKKKLKPEPEKVNTHKSHKEKKEKKSTSEVTKTESKLKSIDKKGNHKSSSTDTVKKRDKHKDKILEKKKHHSESKLLEKSSKSSKHSSKSSERHSNHSSRSKSNSKEKKEKATNCKSTSATSRQKTKSMISKNKMEKSSKSSDNDNFKDVLDCDELCEEISESDEEDIALECKRIFEEYVPVQKAKTENEIIHKELSSEEYIPTKKRISRTVDKNIKIIPKEPIKPDYKVSAAQKMAERLTKIREFHASKNVIQPDSASNNEPFRTGYIPQSNLVNHGKIRIAHVPYASTLLNAKKSISNNSETMKTEPTTSTSIQTVKKGAQRVAHVPNEKFIDRPGVLEPLASKIPANIRSTYLNMMIDECLKIYLSAIDAYARAQHEELATSKKCTTIQIYKNSAVLTISRLRKEIMECNGVKKVGSDCTQLQRIPSAISGTSGNAGSWSIESKSKRTGDNTHEFHGAKFYENVSKWILSEEQLKDNGFPRIHPSGQKGRAMIYAQNKQKPPKGIFRVCCRCKKEYTVDKKGLPAVKEECIYHPNNKYRFRGEVKYQCCSQDGTSDGCCVAPSHVYEYVDYENLKGYVRTLPPEKVMDDYGVYSLDCEMCYTTQGLDLTRITVINSDCKVVYETLIKPLHPIIDYNTRYSGITEEQMEHVKTTLLEVQATLLTMFNSKTILIGHSLESDFKALKLIHDTVVDTSVIFPHKMGPPYKRALRNLSSEYLKKIIQNSVEGHDSAEDATVCMELIHYKLKEYLKTR